MNLKTLAGSVVLVLLSTLSGTSYGTDIVGWRQLVSGALTVSFNGMIGRGERFEKPIRRNLVFRLEPFDGGRSENFAGVVQIPLRFNRTLAIMAWHFDNRPGAPGSRRGRR